MDKKVKDLTDLNPLHKNLVKYLQTQWPKDFKVIAIFHHRYPKYEDDHLTYDIIATGVDDRMSHSTLFFNEDGELKHGKFKTDYDSETLDEFREYERKTVKGYDTYVHLLYGSMDLKPTL